MTCPKGVVPGKSVQVEAHGQKFQVRTPERALSTEGPSWGHSKVVLGAIRSFLEPFCGHLSSKIDKVSEELTLRYPHEEPCVATVLPTLGSIDCPPGGYSKQNLGARFVIVGTVSMT